MKNTKRLRLRGPFMMVSIDHKALKKSFYFYMRDDGALILTEFPDLDSKSIWNLEFSDSSHLAKYIKPFKLKNGWDITKNIMGISGYIWRIYLKRVKDNSGISFNICMEPKGQSTQSFDGIEIPFLSPLDVKLIRVKRDKFRQSKKLKG